MLSNIFARLRTSIRPIQTYQQHFLRLSTTTESVAQEKPTTERETGIVKRFSKDKGYGFISKNSDGTDCFVHFKNINATGFKTLEQGQEVEFTIVQGEKGIEAKDVNIIGGGTSRASFMSGSKYNNSTSSKFGFGGESRRTGASLFDFGGVRSSKPFSEKENSNSTERTFNFRSDMSRSTMNDSFSSERTQTGQNRQIGLVKRWTGEQGFGFIRPTNGGPDLFCHVRSLKNGLQALEEGQTVQFRIQRTNKGDEARDVSIFNGENEQDESTPSIDSNQRQTGVVRRWLSEKGYGFLRLDNSQSDVFVHSRELSDGLTSLEDGQSVEFNIKNGEKGLTASNVTIRSKT